ncbi:toxin [Campylobacter sp. MIT 99-7217]|uniref:toxin n=1 Tax=Campylobacter sp. MIT 99-7217 TaxID=535091 RepID=UPI00115AEB50|nr:toxin [Campylobacter sp. MIT 99-7217]TQR31884.1 toxin [Campylobacter sp. MIT 99-7217]
MKILAFILLFFVTAFAESVGENVTDSFQIRNVNTGLAINLNRGAKQFNYQNWFLKELGNDPKIKKVDKFANSFPFGYAQFVVVAQPNMCLSIAPSGFMVLKDCKKDYESGEFETIFQLIPTTSGAMQIRSLLLNTDECLGTYENPNVDIHDRVGLVRCVLEFFVGIEPKQLFMFSPPLNQANVIQ